MILNWNWTEILTVSPDLELVLEPQCQFGWELRRLFGFLVHHYSQSFGLGLQYQFVFPRPSCWISLQKFSCMLKVFPRLEHRVLRQVLKPKNFPKFLNVFETKLNIYNISFINLHFCNIFLIKSTKKITNSELPKWAIPAIISDYVS